MVLKRDSCERLMKIIVNIFVTYVFVYNTIWFEAQRSIILKFAITKYFRKLSEYQE